MHPNKALQKFRTSTFSLEYRFEHVGRPGVKPLSTQELGMLLSDYKFIHGYFDGRGESTITYSIQSRISAVERALAARKKGD
jgi:hypothetical protein